MIYLVTNQKKLFDNDLYKIVGVEESLELLSSLKMQRSGTQPYQPRKSLLNPYQISKLSTVFSASSIPTLLTKQKLLLDTRVAYSQKYSVGQNSPIKPRETTFGFYPKEVLTILKYKCKSYKNYLYVVNINVIIFM